MFVHLLKKKLNSCDGIEKKINPRHPGSGRLHGLMRLADDRRRRRRKRKCPAAPHIIRIHSQAAAAPLLLVNVPSRSAAVLLHPRSPHLHLNPK